ncbi:hypothetical protein IRZ71_24325 [Flavobacterium sp. ANB]|uniref:hypothetical protein n=1 Tax=unclassified Flavobacterium TaxID=196869 RepID=UPI0012B8E119|nr:MULTISPECIES: hypothetical protein [unclassified Flavobacterium]MBF4519483.1 hypothetical protein [Flavobacterium sp. ANB]MTD72506.1 hypothetical protein [Flavobacterium sp. LC2016-13]
MGLQKLTDFSTLNTLEQFQRIFDENPAEHKKLLTWLQEQLNDALSDEKPTNTIDRYFDLAELALSVNGYNRTPQKVENFKNQRWTVNEQLIARQLHLFTKENQRTPTVLEISQATGLSRTTVHKHLLESDYTATHKQQSKEVLSKLREKAIGMIYSIGMQNNDVKALARYVELTTEREPKNIKNYIQINNNRIDNLVIENLPPEAQRQIEKIILLNQ